MRLKYHFSLLFATLFLSFLSISCTSETGDTDTPGGIIPANPFTLTLSGSSVDDLKLNVAINSDVEVSNYVVGLASAADLASLGTDSLSIASYVVTELAARKVNYTEVDNTYVFNGPATVDLAAAWDLDYSTEYYIAAFAVDLYGCYASGINYTTITTDEAPVIEPEILSDAFALEVSEVSDLAAFIKVTPIEEVVNYYVICQEAALVEADELAAGDITLYYNSTLEALVAAGGFDFSTPDALNLYTGEAAVSATNCFGADLTASTDYIMAVAAIAADGSLLSDVASIDFTTEETPVVEPDEPEILEDAFTFTTLSATTSDITFNVEKNEAVDYYFISALTSKAFKVGYGSAADYYIGTVITSAQATSTDMNVLVNEGLAYSASADFNISTLCSTTIESDTEYTVVVVGVASDASYTTTVSTFTPSTAVPLPSDAFAFELLEVTTTTAKLSITPISSIENYYVVCEPYATVANYAEGDYATLHAMMVENKLMFGGDFAETDGMTIFNGSKEIDPSMCLSAGGYFSAATTYSVIVAGVAADGTLTSEVSHFNITTPVASGDTDPFNLEITSTSSSDVSVLVTPAANVAYYYAAVIPKTTLDSYYSGDADYYIKDTYSYNINYATLYSGEQTLSINAVLGGQTMKADTEYVLMVLALNEAKDVMSSMSINVTAEAETTTDPAAALFTMVSSGITSSNIDFTVIPTNESDYYYASVVSAANLETYYAGDFQAYMTGMTENAVSMLSYGTLEQLAGANMIYSGQKVFNPSGTVTPDTQYHVVAVTIAADGTLSEEMHISATTLPEEVVAASSFNISVDVCAENDLQFTVTPSDNSIYYYTYIATAEGLTAYGYPGDIVGYAQSYYSSYLGYSPDMLQGYGITYLGANTFKVQDTFGGYVSAGTDYYIGVIEITNDGQFGEATASAMATGAGATAVAASFDISVDVCALNDIQFTVIPSDEGMYYYAYIASESDLKVYGYDGDIITCTKEYYSSMLGYDPSMLIGYNMVYAGTKTFKAQDSYGGYLSAGANYYLGVVEITSDGQYGEVTATKIVTAVSE